MPGRRGGRGPPAGSSSQTATPAASETRPVAANDGAHPAEPSSRVSGTVAARFPAIPSIVVTDTASGYRRAGKSCTAKRITLTKVSASPQPSAARASRAAG